MRPERSKQSTITVYTLEAELEVRDGSGVTADDLVERVMDAVFAYEVNGRLFAGRKTDDGDTWICAAKVRSTKIERKTDDRARPFNEEAFRKRFPFRDETQADTSAALNTQFAIDKRIEKLRDLEAKLGNAAGELRDAQDRKGMVALRSKLRGMVKRARAKLTEPITVDEASDEN